MVPGQAWVCLGKLSLADEALAKKCLPLFVQVGGREAGRIRCVCGWAGKLGGS